MTDTKHNVNINFKVEGTKGVTDAVGDLGKELKKVQQQNTGQQKKQNIATASARTAETTYNKTLAAQNKLMAVQNREISQRIKLFKQQSAQAAKQRANTFGGGFTAGINSRIPGAGGGPGAFGAAVGSMVGGAAVGALVGLLGAGVALITKLVAMPFESVQAAYDANQAYEIGLAKLAGYGGGGATKETVDALRTGRGQTLGYRAEEIVAATAQTARATGNARNTDANLLFSRLLGEDTGATASMFGALTQAGSKDFTAKGEGFRQIVKAIAAGMTTGLEKARMPEFLEGVTALTASAAGRTTGDVDSTTFARLLAQLGSTGKSGLIGARGVAVAKALEEGFSAPGGGEEGQALALSIMGFGRDKSWYEASRDLQLGSDGDPRFVQKMLSGVLEAYGGNKEEAVVAAEAMLGGRLTKAQLEGVYETMQAGGDPSSLLREEMKSERDVLVDIRELLRGEDPLLDAVSRAARLQNEQIKQGDKYKDALEKIQDILNKFVDDMMPTVARTLEGVANLLTELQPAMTALAGAINRFVVSQGLVEESMDVFQRENKTYEEVRPLITNATKMLSDEEVMQLGTAAAEVTAGMQERMDAVQQRTFGPVTLASIADGLADMSALATGGTTSSEAVTEAQRTSLARLDNILTRLNLQLNAPNVTGSVDTQQERENVLVALRVFLAAHNLSLPEARALPDRTGGPR